MGPRIGGGTLTGSSCCEGYCSTWSMWSSRSNYAWGLSGTYRYCLEPLAGPHRWITVDALRSWDQGTIVIFRQQFSSWETALGQLLGLHAKWTLDNQQVTIWAHHEQSLVWPTRPWSWMAQQSINPPSNGSGMYMIVSEKILKAQLSYMKQLPKHVCFRLYVGYDGGGIVTLLLSSFGNSAWYKM